jgi:hypothetical protein
MNLKEFQNKARSTAIYLRVENSKMIYPALGLVGECGEVAEKIKKMIRDDDGEITPERREAIKKELGDVMWYIANICCDIDSDMEKIYRNIYSINTPRAHDITTLILPRLVLRMNRYASSVATRLEQWYYMFGGSSEENDRFSDTHVYLGLIIGCVEEIAFRFGFTLEEIYTNNIEKLLSRKRRGKLGGSGDDR